MKKNVLISDNGTDNEIDNSNDNVQNVDIKRWRWNIQIDKSLGNYKNNGTERKRYGTI